jgi:hypothetical protein
MHHLRNFAGARAYPFAFPLLQQQRGHSTSTCPCACPRNLLSACPPPQMWYSIVAPRMALLNLGPASRVI